MKLFKIFDNLGSIFILTICNLLVLVIYLQEIKLMYSDYSNVFSHLSKLQFGLCLVLNAFYNFGLFLIIINKIKLTRVIAKLS